MPATSKTQQRLMAAAAHGASFKKAQDVRQSMSLKQLKEFADTPTKKLPERKADATDKADGIKHQPAMKTSAGRKPGGTRPHNNLGTYLHPKKAR